MPRARPNGITDDQILEAYQRLKSTPKVCAELGLGSATVYHVLERHRVKRVGERATKWEPGQYPGIYKGSAEEIVELYQTGLSIREVSKRIGRSTNVVLRRLRAAGVASRPFQGGGSDHSMWKGGTINAGGGYRRVWVAADDQFASMRTDHGYVLEHRLVMAKGLGRSLSEWETVHHINGDTTDNRLENLQLRQGRHGAHIAMRCLDCGSHNVAAVPLEDA